MVEKTNSKAIVYFKGRMKRIYMAQGEDGIYIKYFRRELRSLNGTGKCKKCAVTVRMEGKFVKEQIVYLAE